MTIFSHSRTGLSLAAFEAMRAGKPETRHQKVDRFERPTGGTSLIPLGNSLQLMLR
ncbi:MAG: hypothetical protein AAFR93_14910 [Pseudomonadota bacterium]